MTGSRKKRPPNSTPRGKGTKKSAVRATRGSQEGRRRNATGGRAGGHRKQKGAKVIPLPRGIRRSRRSGPPERRKPQKAVGRGRLRLVVGAVVVVCLSLGARAAQLTIVDDGRYQTFDDEALAAEHWPESAMESGIGRGAIISANGQQLATSLNAAKVISTPYLVEDSEKAAEALAEVLGSEAGDAAKIEERLAEKNEEGGPGGYSVVAEEIEPEKAREVQELGLPGAGRGTSLPERVARQPARWLSRD